MTRSVLASPRGSEFVRRPILITACVAGLAAATMAAGCSTGQSSNRWRAGQGANYQYNPSDLNIAAYVSPSDVAGRYDRTWYEVRAQREGLPASWVNEATANSAQQDVRRAAALATAVRAETQTTERLAATGVRLQEGYAREREAAAESARLRSLYDARLDEMSAHASVAAEAIEAEARRNDAFLYATQKERSAEAARMRSEASAGYERAQAEYERMLSQRRAVEREGVAKLAEMTKIADMIEVRSRSQTSALRAEADAARQQAAAEAQHLTLRVKGMTEQFSARTKELRQQAASLEEQSEARAMELFARAEAVEAGDINALHNAKVAGAEAAYTGAVSEANELRVHAETLLNDLDAEVERRSAEATRVFETAFVDRDQRAASIETRLAEAQSEIDAMRAQADELEAQARARFVAAQASAKAEALRRDARLTEEASEAQRDKVRAEAEAEAARIRSEVVSLVALQIQRGQVSLQDIFKVAGAGADPDAPAPEAVQIAPLPASIEPGHVASFKTALAESMLLRAKADVKQREADANFGEHSEVLQAWWTEREAARARMSAEIDAFRKGVQARAVEMQHQAESLVRLAEVQMDRDRVEAESFRKERYAEITRLRAEGAALREKAKAGATRLLAEAEANDRAGAAEVRAMEVRIQSLQRRADAEVRSLRAEAESLERTQQALVAQMRQEIKSTQQILSAELARLDQTATSFVEMAQASYNEANVVADAYAARTDALLDSLRADHDAARRIAIADVSHLRNVIDAGELLAQANVERWGANARAERELADAHHAASRATILADADALQAGVLAELAKADAHDETARAQFEARIASHHSRNAGFSAQQYLAATEQEALTRQALAAAASHQEQAGAALRLMHEKSANFQRAASLHWDARLATHGGDGLPALNPREGFNDEFFKQTRIVRVIDND